MSESKRYVVAQERPSRLGLIITGWHWQPILDTDNLNTALRCKENWQRFDGYKAVIADFTLKELK